MSTTNTGNRKERILQESSESDFLKKWNNAEWRDGRKNEESRCEITSLVAGNVQIEDFKMNTSEIKNVRKREIRSILAVKNRTDQFDT